MSLDTYANLFFHGDGEQDDKVKDENRPEDRDVEEIKQRTQHSNQQCLQCTVPDSTHIYNKQTHCECSCLQCFDAVGWSANLNFAQTDNHTSIPPLSFLQAGCPSCRPANSVKALKVYS